MACHLLNPFVMESVLMPELTLFAGAPASSFSTLRMSVEDTDKAYLLTTKVPGTNAADVTVEVQPTHFSKYNLQLKVNRKEGQSVERRLELPEDADVANVTAWCADGVLRITVPKLPAAQPVKIQAQAAAPPETAMEVEGDAPTAPAPYELVRNLPGFAASEVELVFEGDLVNVHAKSQHGFGERRLSFSVPEDALAAETTAFCHNGVLTVRIPRSAPVSPLAVTVKAAGEPINKSEVKEEQSKIARLNVPGYGAEDIKITMHEDRIELALTHPAQNKKRKLVVSLPAALQQWYKNNRGSSATEDVAAPVEAVVGDGVLLLTAAKAATELPSARVVNVEAERPVAPKA
eukprot:scaffold2261_cov405-Prasinococcus_capsulatus_cf.AAC.8